MSEAEVTKSLANKLAAANLTDDEANLLVTLIHAERDEVEGFVDRSSPGMASFNLGMPPRVAAGNTDGWIEILSVGQPVYKPGG
jgi:hypothetical protein